MKKFAGLIATSILASDFAGVAAAQELIATRNIRAGEIIAAADIVTPGSREALRRAVEIIGMETSRAVYRGQPLDQEALRKPTLVERNAVVYMEYNHGPMTLSAEGRALDKGAMGERIRVMNLASKRVVTAIVTGADSVRTSS